MIGAESTGKSTLATGLHRVLGAPVVWETLRDWVTDHGRTPRREEQAEIFRHHQQMESELVANLDSREDKGSHSTPGGPRLPLTPPMSPRSGARLHPDARLRPDGDTPPTHARLHPEARLQPEARLRPDGDTPPPHARLRPEARRQPDGHTDDGRADRSCPWVISDAGPLMTAVYSIAYFDDASLWPAAMRLWRNYARVFWCDAGFPGRADPGQRDGEEVRMRTHQLISDLVDRHRLPVVRLSGPPRTRLESAVSILCPAGPYMTTPSA